MKIAVVGAGRVGRALGTQWSAAGHDVVYGVRDPGSDKVADLSAVASVADAVGGSEVALISLPWAAVHDTLSGLVVGDAIIVDATNPLAAGDRELAADPTLSGGELVRRWSGASRVVKAFNTTGSGNMVDPNYGGARVMMPVAGDDEAAKQIVIGLADQIGFEGIDAGPLAASRDLEHLAMLWIRLAYPLGHGPDIAFGLLRR